MKYTIFGLLNLLWLVGCQSDYDVITTEKFGDTFQLEIEKSIQVIGQSDTVGVTISSIDDSRCLEGVNCIRAGNAKVTISLSKVDWTVSTLCIGGCHLEDDRYEGFVEQDTLLYTLESQEYEVILKDVLPYPKEDSNTKKEAVLEINLK